MTDMTNDAVKSFYDSEMLVNVWDGLQGILSSSHWIILIWVTWGKDDCAGQ